ncbi:MAG: hypothetical protein RL151_1763, partial [Bacteroidota bacterium]
HQYFVNDYQIKDFIKINPLPSMMKYVQTMIIIAAT